MSRIVSDDLPGTVREWLILSGFLVVLSLALNHWSVLRRADLLFFDAVAPLLQRPAAKKIVLIAIDDATLNALGGWPLRRSIYAEVLDRLTDADVAAVALDVAMTQKGRIEPGGDERLVDAMKRNGRVVTPVLSTSINGTINPLLPVASIAAASYATGEANAYPDADGVVRRFQLIEGRPGLVYPHMSLLLLRASGLNPAACRDRPEQQSSKWSGACPRYLPIGRQRPYQVVSLIDVLQRRVPLSSLNGAIAIIGPTSSVAGARIAGPVAHRYPLTGVEFLATATNGLASGSLIRPVSADLQLLFNLCVLPLLCASLLMLGPRASLLACVLLAAGTCVVTLVLLMTAQAFVFPSAAVAACCVAYPIWSWRRQEALLRYLGLEAARVMVEPSLPDEPPIHRTALDPVRRRVMVMKMMVSRMRRYRQFISDWVDSLPEATLVASSSGAVVMANQKAALLICADSPPSVAQINGRHAADVLREMTSSHRASAFVDHALQHFSADVHADPESSSTAVAQGIEIVDGAGRSLLIKCAAIRPVSARDGGLIFHIADVTQMRMAERQRDITLRFLSHDMRSPQAAILALVEHKRQYPADIPDARFTELVRQYAASALSLADDFLFLARAESRPPQLMTVDLALLLGDAIDDLWPHARAKRTAVRLSAEPDMLVQADVLLLRRAFANLIGNAIKFNPEGAEVTVEISEVAKYWQVAVVDQGIGIPPDQISSLFKEFVRLDGDRDRPGHGLGLAIVKSVIDSLGGQIRVESQQGVGTTFTVLLPKLNALNAN